MNRYCVFFLATLAPLVSNASVLNIPYDFVANQPAIAAEVNENFDTVKSSVDDNDARLLILETLVTELMGGYPRQILIVA